MAAVTKISIEEQVKAIMFGAEFGDSSIGGVMAKELHERLVESEAANRPLRVYAGYDPSKPDLHLGHSITLRKLRQFQDFGHQVIFLIGTFTAQVGDTSDKSKGRSRLTEEQVFAAARTYAEQAFTILDRQKTIVAYNHEWLSKLTMPEFASMASEFTVQQFLVRDNYQKRLEANNPIGLHEFLYALLQGYDAVQLRADVQIGATEQLFNILAGRKLQQSFGMRPCICITYPILVGTDGKMRMSKSSGNYVGLTEPPEEQYGKVMSISDETMIEWIKYVTRWPVSKIEDRTRRVQSGELHPMKLKKELAREVVSMYHGDEAAERAERHFETVHQERQLPELAAELRLEEPVSILELLARVEGVKSRSDARRLLSGGGVKLDGQVVEKPEHLVAANCMVQVGKRRFVRVRFVPVSKGAL
jgi:tyrosyl-tRNA synthetase